MQETFNFSTLRVANCDNVEQYMFDALALNKTVLIEDVWICKDEDGCLSVWSISKAPKIDEHGNWDSPDWSYDWLVADIDEILKMYGPGIKIILKRLQKKCKIKRKLIRMV